MKKHPYLRYLFIASLTAIIIEVISTGVSIFKDQKQSLHEQAEKIKDMNPTLSAKMETMAYEMDTNTYYKVQPYITLFFILLSLAAVIMMWQLNPKGWYLYLLAEFAPYLITIVKWKEYSAFSSFGGFGSGMAVTMLLIMGAFDILFAGLYYYALKESEKLNAETTDIDEVNNL